MNFYLPPIEQVHVKSLKRIVQVYVNSRKYVICTTCRASIRGFMETCLSIQRIMQVYVNS